MANIFVGHLLYYTDNYQAMQLETPSGQMPDSISAISKYSALLCGKSKQYNFSIYKLVFLQIKIWKY